MTRVVLLDDPAIDVQPELQRWAVLPLSAYRTLVGALPCPLIASERPQSADRCTELC